MCTLVDSSHPLYKGEKTKTETMISQTTPRKDPHYHRRVKDMTAVDYCDQCRGTGNCLSLLTPLLCHVSQMCLTAIRSVSYMLCVLSVVLFFFLKIVRSAF